MNKYRKRFKNINHMKLRSLPQHKCQKDKFLKVKQNRSLTASYRHKSNPEKITSRYFSILNRSIRVLCWVSRRSIVMNIASNNKIKTTPERVDEVMKVRSYHYFSFLVKTN